MIKQRTKNKVFLCFDVKTQSWCLYYSLYVLIRNSRDQLKYKYLFLDNSLFLLSAAFHRFSHHYAWLGHLEVLRTCFPKVNIFFSSFHILIGWLSSFPVIRKKITYLLLVFPYDLNKIWVASQQILESYPVRR